MSKKSWIDGLFWKDCYHFPSVCAARGRKFSSNIKLLKRTDYTACTATLSSTISHLYFPHNWSSWELNQFFLSYGFANTVFFTLTIFFSPCRTLIFSFMFVSILSFFYNKNCNISSKVMCLTWIAWQKVWKHRNTKRTISSVVENR